jgi:deoxyribodipyrimidine photolyase-related protein
MVLSNYANLIGVNPKEVNDWFNSMYIDSFDWVVTPNVMGMGLYADGGLMSTKPYVSGASYIKKMSNYCEGCKYDPTIKSGEKACPFNGLYWNFIDQHKDTLKSNPRMSMMVNLLEKMDSETKNNHIHHAQIHLKSIK